MQKKQNVSIMHAVCCSDSIICQMQWTKWFATALSLIAKHIDIYNKQDD